MPNAINCAKFQLDPFRGFGAGAENRHFPLNRGIALTTAYALTCYTVIIRNVARFLCNSWAFYASWWRQCRRSANYIYQITCQAEQSAFVACLTLSTVTRNAGYYCDVSLQSKNIVHRSKFLFYFYDPYYRAVRGRSICKMRHFKYNEMRLFGEIGGATLEGPEVNISGRGCQDISKKTF